MRTDDDDYLEFEGEITAQTPKAIQFLAYYWEEPQWLPRSQIEILAGTEEKGDTGPGYTVRIKEWLCKKNGWEEA